MISCIILAAGLSSRFGSPKALARANDQTIIEHQQTMLLNTRIDELVIVLGYQAEEIKPFILKHNKIKCVDNKDYKLGQTSSFQAGLNSISDASQAIMLLPVDYPAIQKETIDDLIAYFLKHKSLITIPVYEGKKGHPPVFNVQLKSEFLNLKHDEGINSVSHCHGAQTVSFPVTDNGIIQSFNTKEELDVIRAQRLI